MVGGVPDLLVDAVHGDPGGERLCSAQVASEPGVRSAGDQHPNPMTAPEDMGGGPEPDLDHRHTIAPTP